MKPIKITITLNFEPLTKKELIKAIIEWALFTGPANTLGKYATKLTRYAAPLIHLRNHL